MADKSINDLDFAEDSVDTTNTLFVVQQRGSAWKLTGQAFFDAMREHWEASGYIKKIEEITVNEYDSSVTYAAGDFCRHDGAAYRCTGATTGTWDSAKWVLLFVVSSIGDIYQITFSDNTKQLYPVENGRGINTITDYWAASSSGSTVPSNWYTTRQSLTATNKYLWHYQRITFNDGSTPKDTTKTVVGVYGDKGDKGDKGDTGDPATLVQLSTGTAYQVGSSGTDAPTGQWLPTVPAVPEEMYLWTKTTITFNTGEPVIFYSVAYQGKNGTGSGTVTSVNEQQPVNGAVTVYGTDIALSNQDSKKLTARISELNTDISSKATQTDLNTANAAILSTQSDIAPQYSTSGTYSVGDLCVYNSVLYRCTTAISTPEAWTAGHWTSTSIAENKAAQADLDALEDVVDGKASPSEVVLKDGSTIVVWGSSSKNLNDLYTGVVLCNETVQNTPSAVWWLVVSAGQGDTRTQIAYSLFNSVAPKIRNKATNAWSPWDTVNYVRPQRATVTLSGTWSGSGPYTQTVTVPGATITANTKVDVQPNATLLTAMVNAGCSALFIQNDNGTLTAYAIGAVPNTSSVSVQVTCYETA